MATLKTLCTATGWLDRPARAVPRKWFATLRRGALARLGAQLGDAARAGADIQWCDMRCATAVGLARGVVYKVAIALTSRGGPGDLLDTVAACIENHLGRHPTTAVDGLLVFDADDGNLVVQEFRDAAPAQVVVYATSKAAATLAAIEPFNKATAEHASGDQKW